MHPAVSGSLRLLFLVIDFFSGHIYRLLFEEEGAKRDSLPPIGDVLLLDSAVTLASKIRQGKVSSVAVVRAFADRIKEVNGVLNCVVDTRIEEALEDAAAADALVRGSEDPSLLEREKPFLGVPFTTKDCMAVTGLSWTTGLLSRKGVRAEFDADSVAAMRMAGAIPLAVTNVSELCLWMESSNRVYGRTNNPYHPGRIVGGSSGGEACAISSAASVFGVGSDVGGSIRMPSFYCGVFGHKPSAGIVSNKGQLPVAKGIIDREVLTTGPICRYAGDLMPMFKVLAGEKKSAELKLDAPVDLKKLRLFYMTDDGGANPAISPVNADMREAQMKLVERLKQTLGIKCERVKIKNFGYALDIWSSRMSCEPTTTPFCKELVEGRGEATPWWELVKWLCWKSSEHTLPAIGLAIFEKLVGPDNPDQARNLRLCDELRREVQELLGDDGVLLYPSMPMPAPYHGQPLLRPFNFVYNGVFNALSLPSTQVPLGLGSLGLPLGAQLVGGAKGDRNTIALAVEVEKLFGGWVPPTGVL